MCTTKVQAEKVSLRHGQIPRSQGLSLLEQAAMTSS
jgi:hypothetical protein